MSYQGQPVQQCKSLQQENKYQIAMPFKDNKFLLDGQTLTIEQLDTIITNNIQLDLTPEAWKKVEQSRQIIHEMMSDNKKVVYGINTGFGNFADKIISFDERTQLQNNLIRSHSVGVGNNLPLSTVKRMMILRINTLSKGRSGIQPQNLRKYINACNKNYIPLIPQKGTVGASGDLAPLSHLALGMMGQGLAWCQQQQKFKNASQIMEIKKLEPIKLKQKQGLALINGTQFMTGILSEVYVLATKLLQSAIIIYAFTVEIFGVQRQLLSAQCIDFYQKTQPSIGQIMKKLRQYLDENPSQLHEHRIKSAQKNNRAYSIILAIENMASLLETLNFCKKIINEQMNSATDNPLVYSKKDGFDEDKLISAGNFHGEYVAKSADFISMSLFGLGRFSQARIQRYINDRISNLPGFLTKNGGLNSGYMIVQYTSAALLSESKVLAKPGSTDSISTSASQQDHVSMGGYASRKSKQILQNISYILGIQFMCALQSVDIINKQPSQKLKKIHKLARKYIEFIQQDKYFGPQIQIVKDLVQKGLNKMINDK